MTSAYKFLFHLYSRFTINFKRIVITPGFLSTCVTEETGKLTARETINPQGKFTPYGRRK